MPAGSVYAAPVGTPLGSADWKLVGHTKDGITMTEPFVCNEPGVQMWFDESGEYWPSDTGPILTVQDRVNRSLIGAAAAAKGWKPAGFANETPAWLRPIIDADISRIAADMKKASESFSIKQPVKWSAERPGRRPYVEEWLDSYDNSLPQQIKRMVDEEYIGNFRHRFITGIDPANFNERSKPVSLTKDHHYVDGDGDWLRATPVHGRSDVLADIDTSERATFFVTQENSVPLALNTLGYDRPELNAGPAFAAAGRYCAGAIPPSGPDSRDELLAKAIANLQAVDRYDQRQAQRRAEEEAKAAEWEEKVAAEAKAREAAAKERAAERAKEVYVSAIIEQHQTGVTAESVAKVQAALSAYETARRKAEGLPN